MATDWRTDLEKKLKNVVRAFVAEVKAHGDEDQVMDDPSIEMHIGEDSREWTSIHVFAPPIAKADPPKKRPKTAE